MESSSNVTSCADDVRKRERRRKTKQVAQGMAGVAASYRATHEGQFNIPTPKAAPKQYRGQMCPSGLALDHPAAQLLLDYAHGGCPVNTALVICYADWSRHEYMIWSFTLWVLF
jgi:hypothetical protein